MDTTLFPIQKKEDNVRYHFKKHIREREREIPKRNGIKSLMLTYFCIKKIPFPCVLVDYALTQMYLP